MARDDSEETDDDRTGTMRARTWAIAANFRTPADYGVPTAPSFPTERRADGTLVLIDPDDSTPVMTVGEPVSVRR